MRIFVFIFDKRSQIMSKEINYILTLFILCYFCELVRSQEGSDHEIKMIRDGILLEAPARVLVKLVNLNGNVRNNIREKDTEIVSDHGHSHGHDHHDPHGHHDDHGHGHDSHFHDDVMVINENDHGHEDMPHAHDVHIHETDQQEGAPPPAIPIRLSTKMDANTNTNADASASANSNNGVSKMNSISREKVKPKMKMKTKTKTKTKP